MGWVLVHVRRWARVAPIALAACVAREACAAFGSSAHPQRLTPCVSHAQLTALDNSRAHRSPFLHLGFPAVVFTYVKGTPMYGLKTENSFDAAHFLTDYHGKCDHSFVVEEGSLAPDTLACLEREGFSLSVVPFRTTAENFARYFYGKLADAGFPVSQVDVYETPNNCAIYRG